MSVETSLIHADGFEKLSSAIAFTAERSVDADFDIASLLFKNPAYRECIAVEQNGNIQTETVSHAASGIPLFERKSLIDDEGTDQTMTVTLFPMGHSGAFGNRNIVLSSTGITLQESGVHGIRDTVFPKLQHEHLSRLLIRLSGLENE